MNRTLGFALAIAVVLMASVVFVLRRSSDAASELAPDFATDAASVPVPGAGPESAPDVTSVSERPVSPATEGNPSLVSHDAVLVGRSVCKECHPENFQLHAKSGHAATLFTTRDPDVHRTFVGKQVDVGPPYGSFAYLDDAGGLKVVHSEQPDPFALQFAFGSGVHGRTLLSLVPDPDGGTMGVEHHVTWYETEKQFGITPGHEGTPPNETAEFFGDLVRGETLELCVSCHTTSANIVGQTITDLVPNINCEKCHGPGSQHVRQARDSDTPPPFSVGRADWDTESEVRLCGSCHRMPVNFTARELRNYSDTHARFQPVGLLRSECFVKSEGKLKCTTCHNPHRAFGIKPRQAYVQNCVECHTDGTASHVICPVNATDGCIECHMPPRVLEHGVTFHDHWIRAYEE